MLAASGELSPRAGSHVGSDAGEDMMQDFVRLHMMSILQPFADRTGELQAQVQFQAAELLQLRESTEAHTSKIQEHALQLTNLETNSSKASGALDAAQAELAAAKRERNRLDGNHEMTKAGLGKAKDGLERTSAAIATLEQALAEANSKINGLEAALLATETKLADEMEKRLDKQGKACKDLNVRQTEVMKACEHAKSLGEKANQALKKLSNEHESKKKEDGGSLSSLQERAAAMEVSLAAVENQVARHAESNKVMDKEVQNLKTLTERLKHVDRLQEKQAEAVIMLETQASRVDKVELEIVQMNEESMSHRLQQNAELNQLEQTVNKNIADTVKWLQTQKAHVDVISTSSQRLQELELGQSKLSAASSSLEAELQGFASWKQGVMKEMESQGSSIMGAHAGLSNATDGISAANASMQSLKSDLSTEQEALKKISTRVDQCYKFFNGFGKGLQETHRQIVSNSGAEGGMLPPKLGGGALLPLPSLTTTPTPTVPKTPKSRLPSPRRANSISA